MLDLPSVTTSQCIEYRMGGGSEIKIYGRIDIRKNWVVTIPITGGHNVITIQVFEIQMLISAPKSHSTLQSLGRTLLFHLFL